MADVIIRNPTTHSDEREDDTKENLGAILAILNQDPIALAKFSCDKAKVINQIKNNLQMLEWYLEHTYGISIGNTNVFSGVDDLFVYDLYKQYGIEPNGFCQADLTEKQWQRLVELSLTPGSFCEACSKMCNELMNSFAKCAGCLDPPKCDCHECTYGHPLKLIDLKFEKRDDRWFVNNIPIELSYHGCKQLLDEYGVCEQCEPVDNYSDPPDQMTESSAPQ